jgi:hypothetical protein
MAVSSLVRTHSRSDGRLLRKTQGLEYDDHIQKALAKQPVFTGGRGNPARSCMLAGRAFASVAVLADAKDE